MILIISDEHDRSTHDVIEWLIFLKKKYYRINISDNVRIEELRITKNGDLDYTLSINKRETLKFSDITSYWYRRGSFNLDYKPPEFENADLQTIKNLLKIDKESLIRFLHHSLRQLKKGIGFFYDNEITKLLNLKIASECGLKIPETFLSDNKKSLSTFITQGENYITKSNDVPLFYRNSKEQYVLETSKFDFLELEEIPSQFHPTKFQRLVEKKFELRIFYLNGKCFPMAIFSQNDEQTKIDFRNYNWEKPNRTVPYKLPSDIEEKLIRFMHQQNLTSGSIDMIYSLEGEYIFLEVNVVGQFMQVSKPCNYNLEGRIAEQLN